KRVGAWADPAAPAGPAHAPTRFRSPSGCPTTVTPPTPLTPFSGLLIVERHCAKSAIHDMPYVSTRGPGAFRARSP
ncbi:hypothetical protein, partial [Streptomyces sp. MBT60]|uniref:hypothetical protein n=1 Tax=Streptomyces sp. MBT60 TaxID=2800409 RepID=UPI001F3CBABA